MHLPRRHLASLQRSPGWKEESKMKGGQGNKGEDREAEETPLNCWVNRRPWVSYSMSDDN